MELMTSCLDDKRRSGAVQRLCETILCLSIALTGCVAGSGSGSGSNSGGSTMGIITTVAGDGGVGSSGDGGLATNAELYYPFGVALDGSGNMYIADWANNRIRKVTASNGVISTVAGDGGGGFSGDGGLATNAELYQPEGVVADSSGNLYIADSMNNRIRKVTAATGIITTIAGGGTSTSDGIAATSAKLNVPPDVALDGSGNLYIACGPTVRKVALTTGLISTVAGGGSSLGDGGPALSAQLWATGIVLDGSGNLYIAGNSNAGTLSVAGINRIRKVAASTGIITTVAGNGYAGVYPGPYGGFSGDGGPATSAELFSPNQVAVDGSGNIYIADTYNNRVRKVTAATGIINTIAGLGPSYVSGSAPCGGNGSFGGDGGLAINAGVNAPFGVAVDSSGNLYIADTCNSRIRKVTF